MTFTTVQKRLLLTLVAFNLYLIVLVIRKEFMGYTHVRIRRRQDLFPDQSALDEFYGRSENSVLEGPVDYNNTDYDGDLSAYDDYYDDLVSTTAEVLSSETKASQNETKKLVNSPAKLVHNITSAHEKGPDSNRTVKEPIKLVHNVTSLQKKGSVLNNTSVRKSEHCSRGVPPLHMRLVFAKTHKTASTTLQNILLRLGKRYELNFAFPPDVLEEHSGPGVDAYNWTFSMTRPFNATDVTGGPWQPPPGPSKIFNLFVFHGRWNYPELARLFPPKLTTFITILRDPVDSFESMYIYNVLGRHYKRTFDINAFASKFALNNYRRTDDTIFGRNQLLYDLGITSREMLDRRVIDARIESIASEFQLVLITEMFDESLILLKHQLCLSNEDLIYLKSNERKDGHRANLTDNSRAILHKWLWADYLLYDRMVSRLDKKIEAFGRKRMRDEVAQLQKLNDAAKKKCVISLGSKEELDEKFKVTSPIVWGYQVNMTQPGCADLAKTEPAFVQELKEEQKKRMKKA